MNENEHKTICGESEFSLNLHRRSFIVQYIFNLTQKFLAVFYAVFMFNSL